MGDSSESEQQTGTDFLAREFFNAGGSVDVSLNNTFDLLNSTAGSVLPPNGTESIGMESEASFASLGSEIAYAARVSHFNPLATTNSTGSNHDSATGGSNNRNHSQQQGTPSGSTGTGGSPSSQDESPTINVDFTPSSDAGGGQPRSSPSPVSASKYIERSLNDLDDLINQRRQELMELRKSHHQKLGISPERARRPPPGAGASIVSSLRKSSSSAVGAGASREAVVQENADKSGTGSNNNTGASASPVAVAAEAKNDENTVTISREEYEHLRGVERSLTEQIKTEQERVHRLEDKLLATESQMNANANRVKTLATERNSLDAKLSQLEEELLTGRDELLFVRGQLQIKSGRILELENELLMANNRETVLRADADTLSSALAVAQQQSEQLQLQLEAATAVALQQQQQEQEQKHSSDSEKVSGEISGDLRPLSSSEVEDALRQALQALEEEKKSLLEGFAQVESICAQWVERAQYYENICATLEADKQAAEAEREQLKEEVETLRVITTTSAAASSSSPPSSSAGGTTSATTTVGDFSGPSPIPSALATGRSSPTTAKLSASVPSMTLDTTTGNPATATGADSSSSSLASANERIAQLQRQLLDVTAKAEHDRLKAAETAQKWMAACLKRTSLSNMRRSFDALKINSKIGGFARAKSQAAATGSHAAPPLVGVLPTDHHASATTVTATAATTTGAVGKSPPPRRVDFSGSVIVPRDVDGEREDEEHKGIDLGGESTEIMAWVRPKSERTERILKKMEEEGLWKRARVTGKDRESRLMTLAFFQVIIWALILAAIYFYLTDFQSCTVDRFRYSS